jgi:hypothetical protein
MTKILSSYYIEGIKEGRGIHSQHGYLCPQNEYENCKELAKKHAGPMKDFFLGQRDFWKNQIKKERT